ncbi:FG-GAP repeat domain-containing protein, partial [Singulisphaera rosea]
MISTIWSVVQGLCQGARLISLLAFGPSVVLAGPPETEPIKFADVAEASGITFRFEAGSRGRHDLPEIMGGGVALIDGDGDGWLDILFCNGGPIVPERAQSDPPGRYYRNNRDGTFTDATRSANVPGPSYAMGAAVGDFDADGRDDLFVTGWRDQR